MTRRPSPWSGQVPHRQGVKYMSDPLPLFPTTVVGSMPRPQYVKDLLRAGSRTGQHDETWQRRMDDAVRFVIDMQEQAGIDILPHGEWPRGNHVAVVSPVAHDVWRAR